MARCNLTSCHGASRGPTQSTAKFWLAAARAASLSSRSSLVGTLFNIQRVTVTKVEPSVRQQHVLPQNLGGRRKRNCWRVTRKFATSSLLLVSTVSSSPLPPVMALCAYMKPLMLLRGTGVSNLSSTLRERCVGSALPPHGNGRTPNCVPCCPQFVMFSMSFCRPSLFLGVSWRLPRNGLLSLRRRGHTCGSSTVATKHGKKS